jgi:aldehyde dehydrogenase (NAD+)
MTTGKYSFDLFTHFRSTLDNPRWYVFASPPLLLTLTHSSFTRIEVIMKMRYPPYTDSKVSMMKSTKPKLNRGSGWRRIILLTAAIALLGTYLMRRTGFNVWSLDFFKKVMGW